MITMAKLNGTIHYRLDKLKSKLTYYQHIKIEISGFVKDKILY
ncbi:hypothetical protein ABIE50_004646 [Chitinophaga sp. OAE865]